MPFLDEQGKTCGIGLSSLWSWKTDWSEQCQDPRIRTADVLLFWASRGSYWSSGKQSWPLQKRLLKVRSDHLICSRVRRFPNLCHLDWLLRVWCQVYSGIHCHGTMHYLTLWLFPGSPWVYACISWRLALQAPQPANPSSKPWNLLDPSTGIFWLNCNGLRIKTWWTKS